MNSFDYSFKSEKTTYEEGGGGGGRANFNEVHDFQNRKCFKIAIFG